MIGFLRGRVLSRTATHVLVDVGGVGYEVAVNRQTLATLALDGEGIALFVRTVVREDAITLHGFDGPVAREVFDLLTGVSGVGPKMAAQILGGMPLPEFVRAVRDKDIRTLATISGVGKKTAERLALELADRFLLLQVEAAPGAVPGLPATLMDEVRSALANLGLSAREIENALRGLKPGAEGATLENLVRGALASRGQR